MTRFARAKGSKSSNEKAPEDGTPWEVMKEQFVKAKKENDEAKMRQAAENQRIENYENFLKERKVQKRKATWCDFPETESNKVKQQEKQPAKMKKKKNKDVTITKHSILETKIEEINNSLDIDIEQDISAQKQNKAQDIISLKTHLKRSVEASSQVSEQLCSKKKKKKNKNFNKSEQLSAANTSNSNPEVINIEKNLKDTKKKNKNNENVSEIDDTDKNVENNKEANKSSSKIQKNKVKAKKKKNKKLVDGKPVRRKEITDRSFQLIINGKEVELVRFDGFPIMKKDAERLGELKSSMIKKGIPKSEVQRTMKLERRRAEKALARLKRDVCYNCRKGGHNLSDCPELKSKIPGADAAEGVCFKCGSTEHRQFECKVQRDKEFRFATCFICKEAGHIARQCPDNPKGLYPNGGCCKLCGDVTHLRKDCPTVRDKKEDSSVKLQTFDNSGNIEDIGQSNTSAASGSTLSYKKPKKIKF